MPLFGLFDRFKPTEPAATRFGRTPEFSYAAKLLAQLRAKETELSMDAIEKNDENSVDNKKYCVVAGLTDDIDKKIATFNQINVTKITQQAIYQLTVDLLAITHDILEKHSAILSAPRNDNRAKANTYTEVSVVGSTVASAVVGAWTFPVGILAAVAAKLTSNRVREMAGLTGKDATSYQLVKALSAELHSCKQNLEAANVIEYDTANHAARQAV